MRAARIMELLQEVSEGKTSPEAACEQLKDLPYKDLGFANVDHHRELRTGFPEVIFAQGKTPEQVSRIFAELSAPGRTVMATRADEEDFKAVKETLDSAVYYKNARIIAAGEDLPDDHGPEKETAPRGRENGLIAVVCAGTSDIPVAEEAAVTALIMGNRVRRMYDVGVAGIHRMLDRLPQIREADVVIAVAGMEGALASVLGGLVSVPVIAVPTSVGYGSSFGGLAALLSMLNSCANGVGVVNIDNGYGAASLASLITAGHAKSSGGAL